MKGSKAPQFGPPTPARRGPREPPVSRSPGGHRPHLAPGAGQHPAGLDSAASRPALRRPARGARADRRGAGQGGAPSPSCLPGPCSVSPAGSLSPAPGGAVLSRSALLPRAAPPQRGLAGTIVSRFWRLGAQNQGVGRAGPSDGAGKDLSRPDPGSWERLRWWQHPAKPHTAFSPCTAPSNLPV